MRICLVYDCLYPFTVGGGERWYRNLAERLVSEGHEVTYLTMRQWDESVADPLPGTNVVAVAPRMALYDAEGRRRTTPPLVFGAGVLRHLLRHGRRYDVVHACSFPYFSLLAAALVRRLGGYGVVVDWFELWSRAYWREYLGALGPIGWWVQRMCLRVPQRAFAFAKLTADRLRAEGLRGDVSVLRGLSALPEARDPQPAERLVVFAGRLIPEKRAPAVVDAVMAARAHVPGLRGVIFGDGPERDAVHEEIVRAGAAGIVDAPGFVPAERVEETLPRALCLLAPSRREGYGLVVVEASAAGVPSIVVAEEDNAAVELVEDGVNGFVAPSLEAVPEAIARVAEGGDDLRRSTADWYSRHAVELSVSGSLDAVVAIYRAAASVRS